MATLPTMPSPHPQTGEQGAGKRDPQIVAATRAVLNETQKSLWQLWRHRSVGLCCKNEASPVNWGLF